jgi:hypothetical protein
MKSAAADFMELYIMKPLLHEANPIKKNSPETCSRGVLNGLEKMKKKACLPLKLKP